MTRGWAAYTTGLRTGSIVWGTLGPVSILTLVTVAAAA